MLHYLHRFTQKLIILLAFFGIVDGRAVAARFPNAIERTVILQGESAASLATLLSLGLTGKSRARVQLGRNSAWAVYLLKKDTPKELSNPDQGMPDRYNDIEFSPFSVPSLTIGPYWLDDGTRAPDRRNGRYSFLSPVIADSQPRNDAWAHLIDVLRADPAWKAGSKPVFQRTFPFAKGAKLGLQVWNFDLSSYVVEISVEGVDAR